MPSSLINPSDDIKLHRARMLVHLLNWYNLCMNFHTLGGNVSGSVSEVHY